MPMNIEFSMDFGLTSGDADCLFSNERKEESLVAGPTVKSRHVARRVTIIHDPSQRGVGRIRTRNNISISHPITRIFQLPSPLLGVPSYFADESNEGDRKRQTVAAQQDEVTEVKK